MPSPYAPDTRPAAATDWRHEALCREEDPDLFFPIGNTGDAILQADQAKAVCRRCPVMAECLSWALETGQDAGVWGGLSEDERRLMKRRAARNKPPKPKPIPKPVPKPELPQPAVLGVRCDHTGLDAAMCAHCRTPPPKTEQGRVLAPCGTTSAYRRHLRHKEPIDYACRLAHNAANRRLRDTGTTKVAA